MCIRLAVAQRHDDLALELAECVVRCRSHCRSTSIGQHFFRQTAALQRAQRNTDFQTSRHPAGPRRDGFIEPTDE